MKIRTRTALTLVFALFVSPAWARAESTAFTYQGNLKDGATAANGNYDLTFGLYASGSGGSSVGGVLTNNSVGITNGLFTAVLDFGNVFDGTAYWLEIAVRPHGGAGGFVLLSPRQALTHAPYAVHALSATTANNTTGAIADSQLSGNVARLNGNATFTGTLTAGGFSGNGAGLTNITAASPGAVLKANNGSDFADTVATANNIGVRVIPGPDFYPNMLNTTPAFAGQLALAQNGGSYPFLYNALSTNKGDWLGSFRFQGICQFGDRTRMRLNYSRAQYSFFMNGYTNQTDDTAGNNVIVLENEHTNHYSAITFQFSPLNNYFPQGEGGSIGVGNCGTPAAFSNALYLHAALVPINFTMAGRPSGAYPHDLVAYFDYPTSDFHYIDNNGNQAFTIRANDGRVSVAGTLTAGVFVGDGSGLTNLNNLGGSRVLYTNAAGVNLNVNGQLNSYSTIILTNSGAPCGVSLPNPTDFDGMTRTIKLLGPAANAITTNNGGSFGDVGLPGELGNPPNYFVPGTNTAYTFCASQGQWWVVGKF